MEHNGLKERLAEAAEAMDRSTEHLRMEVLRTGIRLIIVRWQKTGTHDMRNKFIGWMGIEEARQNPLLIAMRDLINEMDLMEGMRT